MLRELIGVRKVKKYYKQIISILLLIYLLIPFRVSDDEIIYVNNGSIYSGKIETNNLKMLISRIPFIFEIVHIRANLVDEKEMYKLKSGDIVKSLVYNKYNSCLFAIVVDKNSKQCYIKKFFNNNECIIKQLGNNEMNYYSSLHYYNNCLYYYMNIQREENKKIYDNFLEVFNLNTQNTKSIKLEDAFGNICNFKDNIIFSKRDNSYRRHLYIIKNFNVIELLAEDVYFPIKINDSEMICLDSKKLEDMYIYNLENGKMKIIGKNNGRGWSTYGFMLASGKYYITRKNLTGYDIEEWHTVNDLNGGMQILPIDGPIAVY